jgi:APA family basic amino acid/polyamine antiporter
MAESGAFFRGLARLHPTWGTPARATAALAAASVAYVFLASFRNILALFTFSVWIFYGITAVGLLILRRRGVGEPVAWRAPLGWVPPAVVLTVGAGMTVQLVADDPLRALAGAALLAAAFPAYALIARSGGRRR